jgi:hypothetical protein
MDTRHGSFEQERGARGPRANSCRGRDAGAESTSSVVAAFSRESYSSWHARCKSVACGAEAHHPSQLEPAAPISSSNTEPARKMGDWASKYARVGRERRKGRRRRWWPATSIGTIHWHSAVRGRCPGRPPNQILAELALLLNQLRDVRSIIEPQGGQSSTDHGRREARAVRFRERKARAPEGEEPNRHEHERYQREAPMVCRERKECPKRGSEQ